MELAEANKQLTNQMAQITKQFTAITKLIEALPKSTNSAKGARFSGYGSRKPIGWDPHRYCWSCGYRIDKKHNSVTCSSKKDGHQDAATRSNTMGGSQAFKDFVF
eukprot:13557358-Ditylum_brightwellii.AAC.1